MWNQEWLWPEGKVLYYNIVLNKSSNWGVLPWAWYFYSALPRAMFVSIFLVPLGVFLDRRTMLLVVPSILFVFLYSFLPHKELRFIIYVFPLLNVAAAEACKRFWESAKKKQTFFRKLFALGAVLHIVANVIFSSMMLYISSNNYPGGVAMMELHRLESPNTKVNLHIDVFSAQTGVSRFLQMNELWSYNKDEGLNLDELHKFSHLLIESKDEEKVRNLASTLEWFTVIKEIQAFNGATLNYTSFPIVKFNFSPAVTILKKIN